MLPLSALTPRDGPSICLLFPAELLTCLMHIPIRALTLVHLSWWVLRVHILKKEKKPI